MWSCYAYLVAIHVGETWQLAPPARTARFIGKLLIDETAEHARPEVKIGLPVDAALGHRRPELFVRGH